MVNQWKKLDRVTICNGFIRRPMLAIDFKVDKDWLKEKLLWFKIDLLCFQMIRKSYIGSVIMLIYHIAYGSTCITTCYNGW